MSYVDRHLLDGEQVLFRTRLHGIVYTLPVLVSALVFLPLIYFLAFRSEHRWVAALPALGAVVAIGSAFLQQRFSEFAVTNKRVILKLGVLQTRSVELFLPKIEGVGVTQGLGAKLLGYGEIVVTGSGGTKEDFSKISAPLEFRRAVQSATDGASTR